MTANQTTVMMMSAALVACATSDETPHGAQEQEARQDIVGGQATDALPAVGALTRFGGTHCTGTLISPRRVVTAAHCLDGVSASSLRFVIGPSLGQAQAVIRVASVTPHPSYNPFQLTNDIGYVDLDSDAPVAPMALLPAMDQSWVGRELVFVGYGNSNGFSQTGSGIKRFVTMPIQQVMPTQFSYAVPGKNTCNGDSGGPAFAQVDGQLLLAGVTSFGDANCVQFGVDTRTDTYLDFLGVPATGPGTPTTPQDPCQGETFEGRCDGETVIWCENQQVQSTNCAATGRVCGFSESNQFFACLEPAEVDPCQGETFEGRCDGDTVIWCENDEVMSIDCQTCGFDASKGFFNCL